MRGSKTAACKRVKLKSFRDRLKFLVGDDRPYTWCGKVGIEKGLFQYYWQKEKIPKHENLLKIRDYTGCSLDWLITGEGEPFPDRIEDVKAATRELLKEVAVQLRKLDGFARRLKKIRAELKQ